MTAGMGELLVAAVQPVTASELAAMVKRWIPDAQISFDETKPGTPLIDRMDGSRLRNEINFTQRPLVDAIRAHINEARATAGLPAV